MKLVQSENSVPLSTSFRELGGRLCASIVKMMLVWSVLGVLLGIILTPVGETAICYLAGIIAGIIVMSGVGFVCGFVFSGARETFVGAACGAILMAIIGLILSSDAGGMLTGCGLIMGGLMGATFLPLWRLQKGIWGLILSAAKEAK